MCASESNDCVTGSWLNLVQAFKLIRASPIPSQPNLNLLVCMCVSVKWTRSLAYNANDSYHPLDIACVQTG